MVCAQRSPLIWRALLTGPQGRITARPFCSERCTPNKGPKAGSPQGRVAAPVRGSESARPSWGCWGERRPVAARLRRRRFEAVALLGRPSPQRWRRGAASRSVSGRARTTGLRVPDLLGGDPEGCCAPTCFGGSSATPFLAVACTRADGPGAKQLQQLSICFQPFSSLQTRRVMSIRVY